MYLLSVCQFVFFDTLVCYKHCTYVTATVTKVLTVKQYQFSDITKLNLKKVTCHVSRVTNLPEKELLLYNTGVWTHM